MTFTGIHLHFAGIAIIAKIVNKKPSIQCLTTKKGIFFFIKYSENFEMQKMS